MSKMVNTYISTSMIDNNYYVTENRDSDFFILVTLLTKVSQKYADILLSGFTYFRKLEDRYIFIDKDSNLGKCITKLIEDGELFDLTTYINKNTLITALINGIKEKENKKYLEIIEELIYLNMEGNVEELSKIWPKVFLEKIIKNGVNQNYVKLLSNYKPSKIQEKGMIYLEEDNGFYQFDIIKKECIPFYGNKNKKIINNKKIVDKNF